MPLLRRPVRHILWTLFLLILIAGLLAWSMRDIDPQHLQKAITRVGVSGLFLICVIFGLGFFFDVGAWYCNFKPVYSLRLWYGRLWVANFIGEAVSTLAPFGALGGEPVKAWYLNRQYRLPWSTGSASLLLHQIMIALAQGVFLLLCLVAIVTVMKPEGAVAIYLYASAMAIVLLLGLMLWGLYGSALRQVAAWIARLHDHPRIRAAVAFLYKIERILAHQIRCNPLRFLFALVGNFMTWLIGAVETWVALLLLGSEVGFSSALAIEGATVLVRTATFFIPGHLGAQEAVIVGLSSLLGTGASTGLALALLRRARELIWSLPGLLLGFHLGLRAHHAYKARS